MSDSRVIFRLRRVRCRDAYAISATSHRPAWMAATAWCTNASNAAPPRSVESA